MGVGAASASGDSGGGCCFSSSSLGACGDEADDAAAASLTSRESRDEECFASRWLGVILRCLWLGGRSRLTLSLSSYVASKDAILPYEGGLSATGSSDKACLLR